MVQSWNDEDIICGLNGWFHLLWEDSVIQGIKDHKIPLKPAVSKLNAEDLFQPLWFRTNLFLRMTYGNTMGYLIQQCDHIMNTYMGSFGWKSGAPKNNLMLHHLPWKQWLQCHKNRGVWRKPFTHRLSISPSPKTRWKNQPSSSKHREYINHQVKWSSKKSWAAKLQSFFDIQKEPKQDKALELNTHQTDWIGLGQFTGHPHI